MNKFTAPLRDAAETLTLAASGLSAVASILEAEDEPAVSDHGNRKLSDEQVAKAREMWKGEGKNGRRSTIKSLSRRFKVSYHTMWAALNGKASYRHV